MDQVNMTKQKFITTVREKYGSHGVRDAKKFLTELEKKTNSLLPPETHTAFHEAGMMAWLCNKERARQKFTPKKYRQEASVCARDITWNSHRS